MSSASESSPKLSNASHCLVGARELPPPPGNGGNWQRLAAVVVRGIGELARQVSGVFWVAVPGGGHTPVEMAPHPGRQSREVSPQVEIGAVSHVVAEAK